MRRRHLIRPTAWRAAYNDADVADADTHARSPLQLRLSGPGGAAQSISASDVGAAVDSEDPDASACDVGAAVDADLARWCRQQVRSGGPHAREVAAAMTQAGGNAPGAQRLLGLLGSRPAGVTYLHETARRYAAELRALCTAMGAAADAPQTSRINAAGGSAQRTPHAEAAAAAECAGKLAAGLKPGVRVGLAHAILKTVDLDAAV